MRTSIRSTRTTATLAVFGVLVGTALAPASPAAARPADDTSPTGSVPASRADPPGSAAVRGSIGLAVEVTKDGNGPFTTTDEPGGDTNASNGIVRTLDAVTYRVTMNSTNGSSTNERFTLSAPAGTSWAGVPAHCRTPDSGISGRDLTCNLGDIAQGHAVAVPAVLRISGDLRNGDAVVVTGTGTADDVTGPVSVRSPGTTVSAAARYNLSKDVHASILRTGVTGPDGRTEGVQLVYPIAVDWVPLVAGQGLLGFERSDGTMTFTDDVSGILGDLPSAAVLWNRGNPVCGPNGSTEWGFVGLPGGKGGGHEAVVDSGTISCTQSRPGDRVDVSIAGVVTDPTRTPTENVASGPITGGDKPYFVSGYISLWMPNPPAGTSVDSVNTYTPLHTTSVSGRPNFGGGTEPTADNSAKRNITEYVPGGLNKQLLRVVDGGRGTAKGSAKEGDPWATAGTLLRSDVGAWNNGLSDFDHVILCDTFDRRTQRLTRVGDRETSAWTTGLRGSSVQYAAYGMPSPAAGQTATCDDDDGPWFDAPEDVPGGIDAVGAVRATGTLAGGATATLSSSVTTKDVADGTRVYDHGHAWFGDRATSWVHDTSSDPLLGAGPLSDSVIITENLARITKKIVDPGHDATDTPDTTSFVVAGKTVDYALYPTLTNGKADGDDSALTVRDVLPAHTSYVPDSASESPTVDVVQGADGLEHERLTWELGPVTPNTAIAPITYTATVARLAPVGSITNEVEIGSPSDRSDAVYRRALRAVQVVNSGGVGVEKTPVRPTVVAGDALGWDLGYTNTDSSPIHDVDVIDVLPHRGGTGGSPFHGTAHLAEPVRVDVAAGETATYTTTTPERIELDGNDPSNRPGGSTVWCTAAMFGAAGCATTLADVTAFRIQRTAPVAVGETVTHRTTMRTDGEHDGDAYTNRFGLRASNLALPVLSNPATVRVVAGAIGDRVWDDRDEDGLQDDGEPGIGGVPVRLTGTDDADHRVSRETTTDADGGYRFDDLRPGEYVVEVTAPDGRSFTVPLAGDDTARDSDVDADGRTDTVAISRVMSGEGSLEDVGRDMTIDAGMRPAVDGTGASGGADSVDGADGSRPTGSGTRADGATDSVGMLAFTGAERSVAIATALVLLFGGLLVLASGRNRRRRR